MAKPKINWRARVIQGMFVTGIALIISQDWVIGLGVFLVTWALIVGFAKN